MKGFMLKEPLVVMIGIIAISVIIALCITKYLDMKEKKRIKDTRGTYVYDGIWGS